MSAQPIRDQIIAHLNDLTDTQAAKVLDFIEAIEANQAETEYDEASDPMLDGTLFFSGTADLGERAEEILEEGFGGNGWILAVS